MMRGREMMVAGGIMDIGHGICGGRCFHGSFGQTLFQFPSPLGRTLWVGQIEKYQVGQKIGNFPGSVLRGIQFTMKSGRRPKG